MDSIPATYTEMGASDWLNGLDRLGLTPDVLTCRVKGVLISVICANLWPRGLTHETKSQTN